MGNTLHDLYGVAPSVVDSLPEEVVGEGYLNSISPLQSELFLDIANKVVDQVVVSSGERPTELQKRLFGETPSSDADFRNAARQVARSLARDAYRRPPTDAELDVLLGIFDLARENQLDYAASLSYVEGGPLLAAVPLHHACVGKSTRVIPSSLWTTTNRPRAFFTCCGRAARCQLVRAGRQRRTQSARGAAGSGGTLLNDDRSRALFDGFGTQWLGIGD